VSYIDYSLGELVGLKLRPPKTGLPQRLFGDFGLPGFVVDRDAELLCSVWFAIKILRFVDDIPSATGRVVLRSRQLIFAQIVTPSASFRIGQAGCFGCR